MDPDYFSRMGGITLSPRDMVLALTMQAQITKYSLVLPFSLLVTYSYSANVNEQKI